MNTLAVGMKSGLAGMAALLLAACGQSGPATVEAPAEPAPGEPPAPVPAAFEPTAAYINSIRDQHPGRGLIARHHIGVSQRNWLG